MASYRDRYFENFTAERRPAKNKRGFSVVYVYTGDWYSWELTASQLHRRKGLYLLGLVLQIGVFLAAAVQPNPVNTSAYVAIPGLFALAAFLFDAIGIFQFCFQNRQFTVISYRGTHQRICISSLCGAVCTGLASAGCFAYSFLAKTPLSIGVVCGYLISCVICVAFYRAQQKLDVTVRPGKDGRPVDVFEAKEEPFS